MKRIDKRKHHATPEQDKLYREKNKEQINARRLTEYHNNQEFYKEKAKIYYQKNKEEIKKRNGEYKKRKREEWNKIKNENRSVTYYSTIKYKYGLTREDYINLCRKQNQSCAICGKRFEIGDSSFHIDHNHITGKVRGILCTVCNTGLGRFYADHGISLLLKAIEYISKTDFN